MRAFVFGLQLPEAVGSLRRRIRVLGDACEQVMACERLVHVLQKVLAVGNVMNEGTHKGQAAGFTLDSLLKITMTKGKDKKTTVLDAVAKLLGDRGKAGLLDYAEDLGGVEGAARVPKGQLLADVASFEAGLVRVRAEQAALRQEAEEAAAQTPAGPGLSAGNAAAQRKIGAVVEEAGGTLAALRRELAALEEQATMLFAYFGEPAEGGATPLERVFGVLEQFMRQCAEAKGKYERAQEAARKEREKAAAAALAQQNRQESKGKCKGKGKATHIRPTHPTRRRSTPTTAARSSCSSTAAGGSVSF